jgi:hypothetical protein
MKRGLVAMLLLGALLGAAGPARSETVVELSGQEGITLPVLYDPVPRPTVSVILFVGGDGDLAHEAGSFLLRVRRSFVDAGMSVAVPDTPSDHPGGFGPLFRTWSAHTMDVAAIVAFLKQKAPVPVWAVGTSNGTISTANAAAQLGPRDIAGIVLTSSVWLGGLGLVPVENIKVPVLDVQDRDDACPASLLVLSQRNMPRFVAAPRKRLEVVAGGSTSGPRCGTGSPHDFYGVENKVVPLMIDWIKTNGCANPAEPVPGTKTAASVSSVALRCVSDAEPTASARRGLP